MYIPMKSMALQGGAIGNVLSTSAMVANPLREAFVLAYSQAMDPSKKKIKG